MESDELLYARVRAGDMRAFDQLYGRYVSRLFGFLVGQLRSRADAEDVFQEAFLQTLRSREISFENGGSFKTWLYRVARNTALNRLRSEQRKDRAHARAESLEPPASPEDGLAQIELVRVLDTAVAKLPPGLSEIYHLRSSGLSYDEMAEILEIPMGTLKSRMSRMVSTLREEMKQWSAR